MEILIFGSCVSRDAFNFDLNNEFSIVDYFARSSFSTAFDDIKVKDNYSDLLDKPFEKRVLNADFQKTFAETFWTKNFDVLLIDFIDDRFNHFSFYNNEGKVLISSILSKTDFIKKNESRGFIVKGEDKFMDWKIGCLKFLQQAELHRCLGKIVLNKVWWTLVKEDGEEFYENMNMANIANDFLHRQYDFIEPYLDKSQILTYPEKLLKANSTHRWGIAPFHYIDDFYIHTLNQLRCLSGMRTKTWT